MMRHYSVRSAILFIASRAGILIMNTNVVLRRKRPACAGRTILTALAFVLASQNEPALTQVDAQPDTSVFTIIVTRHGVRAISPPSKHPGPNYDWADWSEVGDDHLTAHGYRLMRLMGQAYREAQRAKGLPVDCPGKTAYVYADTVQRTLGTAHALIEGLCDSPERLEVFHAKDANAKDPVFDATARLGQLRKIDGVASKAAVAAVAGNPSSSRVMQHAHDFARFQKLLDSRCAGGGCQPIVSAASLIDAGTTLAAAHQGKDLLAGLKGPIGIANAYSEDVFLEFAQCRPEKQMTSLDTEGLRAALEAGMRLHVLAYEVNARNAYNPLVRGGTLLAHVAAMLNQNAGRTEVLSRVGTPDLKGKTLVIFSGHDTQLGALGGILNAHWTPEGGNVRDDMPPGSALIFDLVRSPQGDYGVHLRFVSMALDQFLTERPLEGAIKFVPVKYTGCPEGGCVMPLAQFESLALTLDAQGLVVDGWSASSSRLPQDPVSSAALKDPTWTELQCHGP
jgi:hypothetical protein